MTIISAAFNGKAGWLKTTRKMQAGGWVWDLPPLFNCRYKVRPRKHGEQTVTVGRRRLVAGAGRVALIGWPAAVYGLPEDTTRGGVSTVSVILTTMWYFRESQVQIYLMMSKTPWWHNKEKSVIYEIVKVYFSICRVKRHLSIIYVLVTVDSVAFDDYIYQHIAASTGSLAISWQLLY